MSHIQTFACDNCRYQIAGSGHKFLGPDGVGGVLVCPEFIPAPDSFQAGICVARTDVGSEKTIPD